MSERAARRLLIVGWDAADWKVIDPLMKQGAMPNLSRLIRAGARSDLATLEPRLSPILWTSIATGKTADRHGILNFVEPDPADATRLRLSSSTTRKTKALWNILTQAGLRTNVVNWYASHPAEPIDGVCVSNLFQVGMPRSAGDPWALPGGAVHPAAMAETIAPLRVHIGAVKRHQLQALVPGLATIPRGDRRLTYLSRALAHCASVQNVAAELLRRDRAWDCTMAFFETIDVVGHHFMQYHPPRMRHVLQRDFNHYSGAINGTYKLHDAMLGSLLDLAGPDTTVMVLSDHGFHSDHQRPPAQPGQVEDHAVMDAAWHRQFGVLVMSGPGVRKGAPVHGPTLLDIAPTALQLLGLPADASMSGRVLTEALEHPRAIDPIPSWDEREGPAGMHPPDLRQDPVEARDAMEQLVELGYLAPLSGDEKQRMDKTLRETRYNLAVVLMITKRAAEAEEIFAALHRELPDEPRYALSLARCRTEQGRHAEAREILGRFIERRPDHPEARLALAGALYAQQRHQEAADILERLDEAIPAGAVKRAEFDAMLGMVYIFLRRPTDARRVFSRALTHDPQSPQAHHGLALAAMGRKQFQEAVAHCLDAIELSRYFSDAHYTLGSALAWMRDYPGAVKSFRAALSIQPGMIEAHRFLAALLDQTGDAVRANEHRAEATRLVESHAARQTASSGIDATASEPPFGVGEWARRSSR